MEEETDTHTDTIDLTRAPNLGLSAQPAFANMEPLHVEEGAHVTFIAYEPEQWEVLSLFRRCVKTGETSLRALELTTRMIGINQADYTAWEWRWRCLMANQVDLNTEYDFTDNIMMDNAKNYQLWNHRRKCAFALGITAAQRELDVADEALRVDAKNYHAWAHRQAVIQEYGGDLWAQELLYADKHIQEDVRNNSAWNQRAFVLRREAETAGAETPQDAPRAAPAAAAASGAETRYLLVPERIVKLLERELSYCAAQIARAPRNESAWNYLSGIFRLPGVPRHTMGVFDEVHVICTEALRDAPSSPCALDVLAQYFGHVAGIALHRLRQSHHAALQPGSGTSPDTCPVCATAKNAVDAAVNYATVLLESLTIADPIRVMYWRQRQQAAQALTTAAQALVAPAQQAA